MSEPERPERPSLPKPHGPPPQSEEMYEIGEDGIVRVRGDRWDHFFVAVAKAVGRAVGFLRRALG
jgi:hypothetical protein